MSETKVNLGFLPVNRGTYSNSATYYKDNIVQYNGSSYICTQDPGSGATPQGITGEVPYVSQPDVPNTHWAVFVNNQGGPVEGIYDVSANHATDNTPKAYDSLSTALADVPTAKKTGGLVIKFIQTTPATYNVVKTEGVAELPTGTLLDSASSIGSGTYTASQLTDFATLPTTSAVTYYVAVTEDEVTTYTTWVITLASTEIQEYVQYRLMKTAWSNVVGDWQGVDDEPTAGSRNLVESGGVYKSIGAVANTRKQNVSDSNSTVILSQSRKFKAGTKIIIYAPQLGTIASKYRLYINNTTSVGDYSQKIVEYTLPSNATIRVTVLAANVIVDGGEFNVTVYYAPAKSEKDAEIEQINNSITSINTDLSTIKPNLSEARNDLYGYTIVSADKTFTGTETATVSCINKTVSLKRGCEITIDVTGIGTTISNFVVYFNGSSTRYGQYYSSSVKIELEEDITSIQIKVLAAAISSAGTCTFSVLLDSVDENIYQAKRNNAEIRQNVSTNASNISKIEKEVNLTEIVPEITWTTGKFVHYNGHLSTSNSAKYSAPVEVKRNDLLIFTCKYSNTYLCALSYVLDESNFNPVIRNATADVVNTYNYRCPKDGYVVFSTATNGGGSVKIIRGMEEPILQDGSNLIGLTDVSLLKKDNGNLFDYTEVIKGIRYISTEYKINTSSSYWTSGYITIPQSARNLIIHGTFDIGVKFDKDFNATGYLDTRSPIVLESNVKYIRLTFENAVVPYNERNKVRVFALDSNGLIGANINGDYFKVDNGDYITKSNIAQYEAVKVFGTYVSTTEFTVDSVAETLSTSKVYIDTTTNKIYRFNGTELYNIGYYDYKSLVFTDSFSISIRRSSEHRDNLIVTANAKYYVGSGITVVPQITFTTRGAGTTDYKATTPYVIGRKENYSRKEWRCYPPNIVQNRTVVAVTVPAGVTLFIDDIGNYYSDKKGHKGLINFDCRGCNAPDQSLAAFEQAVKLGYDRIIVIPKRTSDGVYVCFHDDDNIGSARNEDGTAIENPQPVSSYTYDELKHFEIGISNGYAYADVAWRGQKMPLLEDFFELCSKTGVHPVFSVHPVFTTEQWQEIKVLADKWGVTSRLNLKTGWISQLLVAAYPVFGDDIESYYADVNTDRDGVNEVLTAISTYNIDTTKCRVGIEYFHNRITLARVQNALANNIPVGVVAGDDHEYWITKGVTSFTDLNNPSVGLNF